jgi:hypothetical protein
MPWSQDLDVRKTFTREHRVVFKFMFFGIALIYASYLRLFPQEVPIDAAVIAENQPETSKALAYYTERDFAKLQLVIEGITKKSENFISRKEFYLKKTIEFICNNELLKEQLKKSKPVIIDFLANDSVGSQFANIRVTTENCTNGI